MRLSFLREFPLQVLFLCLDTPSRLSTGNRAVPPRGCKVLPEVHLLLLPEVLPEERRREQGALSLLPVRPWESPALLQFRVCAQSRCPFSCTAPSSEGTSAMRWTSLSLKSKMRKFKTERDYKCHMQTLVTDSVSGMNK